ncbi:metal ABC transporter substrate-binding protein [Arthrobacter sp. Marseille-P9274]|uniref:metal ABC transporter substrate-binding protein n=1 Tax=Arthrobacter sp. Marseille-P9274 TaxID=2866572 RepID=UPI0021C637B0|nr:metal ABC transporter substrate-binding protein [Arthrobacter sp. Marseille-P9274]
MPKKWVVALLVVLGLLALPACAPGTARPAASADERPMVLTTFTVLADLVRQVGGDYVRVESVTKVGAEIHGYQPTPSDLVRAQDADLILDNGLGLERWFARFVAAVPAPHAVLSEGVEPVDIRSGNYQGRPNPHAWMSPQAAKIYVDNTVAALSKLVPEHAGDFAANGEDYKRQLDEVMGELQEAFAGSAAVPALVTCEGAFSYLARDAGLREAFLWPVNSDAEGTPRQIKDAINFVHRHDVPSVFCESTVNPGAMEQVAEATGARLLTPLYVDSLSRPDGPVPSHLSLIRHDIELIKEGLAP